MQCPSCAVVIAYHPNQWSPGSDPVKGLLLYQYMTCPNCGRAIVGVRTDKEILLTWPRRTERPPPPREVPVEIADDYREACLILVDSPKASAALSRRCLERILRSAAGVKPDNLEREISQVLDAKALPGPVAEALAAVRQIGDYAAHPVKSTSPGEVIEVESGEADWNLDVVESLMDIFFVQPVRLTAKKTALNKKLATAGKGPI
jgi:ribosomal protein S27AE